MNIAIDISPVQTGHKARGIGVYTKELLAALEKYGKKHTYQLIRQGQKMPADADIIHYPYFDPFLQTLPIIKSKPTIVTVHDLIPIVFPDKFPKGMRGTFVWQKQKISLKMCQRIITDSQNSKKDIHNITGFGEEKIDVVPLAPRAVFTTVKSAAPLASVRKKYHLPEEFILYVGDVNWNKNILGLLESYALFARSGIRENVPLVLVGAAFLNKALQEVIEINHLIDTLDISSSIIRPGFVPDDDLASLYAAAVCLVQPSWSEGFGFPILEAMASGCPVVTSDIPALAEIAGPAVRVDPADTETLALCMRQMIEASEDKRTDMIRKGSDWVLRFSWKKVALETIQSYERMVS